MNELNKIDNKVLVSYLINEHPQVITLILYLLEKEKIKTILNYFPKALATEVVCRLAYLDDVRESVLLTVISTVMKEIDCIKSEDVQSFGFEKLKEIIDDLPEGVLDRVKERDLTLFEDLSK